MFGITSEYEFLNRTEDYEKGFFAYTMKCILTKVGQKITEGVGQCNTYEGKYHYRWMSEKNLPDGTIKDSLQSRTKQGKYGEYTEYKVENDDPYTLANTVLKMAKKRAQIDAVLTVASLSEVFTQDIEDLREFLQQEQVETMTDVDAKNIKVTFGTKYKGKTLGEIIVQDIGYVKWLSQKANGAVMRKAATELLLEKENPQPSDDKTTGTSNEQSEFKDLDDDDHPF